MEVQQNPQDYRLGHELLKEGLVSETQLRTALEYQRSLGGKLEDIISKLGFADENRLNDFTARRQHMPTIELSDRVIDEDLMRKIPRDVIERHEVIPFKQSPTSILLAMSEPMDFQAIEEIQFLTSCTIETALAPRSQVLAAITRFYDAHPDLSGSDVVDPASVGQPAAEETQDELLDRIADPVVAAVVRALLKKGALDLEDWRREIGQV